MCMWVFFLQNPAIFHTFCIFNLDLFPAQILLECLQTRYIVSTTPTAAFYDPFGTLHMFLFRYVDVYVVNTEP